MPCVHGQCTDQVNGSACNCDDGYEGTNCQGMISRLHSIIEKMKVALNSEIKMVSAVLRLII